MKNKSKKITKHPKSAAPTQKDIARQQASRVRAAAKNARKNIQAIQSDSTVTEEDGPAKGMAAVQK